MCRFHRFRGVSLRLVESRSELSLLPAAVYLTYPDDGTRQELIGGKIFVSPTPSIRHQEVLGRVLFSIADHLELHGGGKVYPLRLDVVLSEWDVVQPDIMFVGLDRAGIINEINIAGPPTLLVEVLSERDRDLRVKRSLYARTGVAEYWIVDPESDWVEVYRLPEGASAYQKPEIFEPGEHLTTDHIPGLAIDLSWLFRRTRAD